MKKNPIMEMDLISTLQYMCYNICRLSEHFPVVYTQSTIIRPLLLKERKKEEKKGKQQIFHIYENIEMYALKFAQIYRFTDNSL